MSVIVAKLGICLILLLVLLLIWQQKERLQSILKGKPIGKTLALYWTLFRLIPYCIIFLAIGIEPTSDVNGFWEMAVRAGRGEIVYRDFWSPYSPIYSYLLGIGTLLWYNPKVIVLTMIIIEGIAVYSTYQFYRNTVSPTSFLYRALLYFLLPGSLILCTIGAQEDVWMWLFVSLAFWLGKGEKNIRTVAFILATGVLFTKAVFVLFLFPLFLIVKDKFNFSWPIALVGMLTLAVLYPLVGWEFLQPMGEADTLRAPNVLSVLNPWLFNKIGMGESYWNWVGLVITIGLGCWTAIRLANYSLEERITRTFIVMFATLMIVQQSAYSNYIFIFLLPLTCYYLNLQDTRMFGFLLFYNIISTLHPSIWWRLGMPKYLEPATIWQSSPFLIDYLFQVLIIISTVFLIRFVLQTEGKPTESQT